MSAAQPIARAAVLALCLAACSKEDDGDAGAAAHDAGPHTRDAAASGITTDAVGHFEITLAPAVPARGDLPATDAFTSLLGRVYEAEVPEGVVWTQIDEEGDCRLFEPSIPACDPACSGGAVCARPNECVPYPASFDVGDVTLSGLQAPNGAIVLRALPPSNTYQLPGGVQLPYPPFAEGDAVAIEAEGGELGAFAIETVAIAPLQWAGEQPFRFAADSATVLRWAPPASSADSRVGVRVDISHHGGQKGEIVCDAADTGSLTIPARLAAGLIDLGVAGFPTLEIVREAVAATPAGDGRIELAVASPLTIELEIAGLVSCDEPGTAEGCAGGQTCGVDRRCQ